MEEPTQEKQERLSAPSPPFFATVRDQTDMLVITLPKKWAEFEGWRPGDELQLVARKVLKKEE